MKNIIKNRYISFILALLMIVGVFLPHGGALAKESGKFNIDIDINIYNKEELENKLNKGESIEASHREVKVYKLKVDKELTEEDRLNLAKEYDALTIADAEKKLNEDKKLEKEIPSEKSKYIYNGEAFEVIDKNTITDFKLENLNLEKERISVKDLEEGYYLIKETDESKKIPKAKLNTFVIKLDKDTVNDKNTIVLDAKVSQEVPNKKNLKLIKVDADNEGAKLDQAQFELYKKVKEGNKEKNQLVKVSGTRGNYIYDENGNTTVLETWNGGEIVVQDVPEGTYYFKETKPAPGYDNSNVGKESDKVSPGGTVTVKNKITPILKKVNANKKDEYLKDAVFKVYNEDGKVLKFKKTGIYYEQDTNGKEEVVTDSNGAIYISDLRPGKYYLEETKSPDGYILSKNKIEFKIKDFRYVNDKGEVDVLIVENKPETPPEKPKTPTGGFNFVKIDSTKKENRLAGAKFILMKKEGTTYKKYLKDGKEVSLTSPSNGEFSVSGLEYGEYALKEIKAPKNYTIDTELTPFKVDAASSSLPATKIVNKPFTPITTTSRQNTITTKYTPSDLTRVIKNPRTIVKTGDIRIIIMAVAGIILLILGIRLVNSDKRTQRA